MEYVCLQDAERFVRCIRDASNLYLSSAARDMRDKWLVENDIGILNMANVVRQTLEETINEGNTQVNLPILGCMYIV
jgi:hypothetical protein